MVQQMCQGLGCRRRKQWESQKYCQGTASHCSILITPKVHLEESGHNNCAVPRCWEGNVIESDRLQAIVDFNLICDCNPTQDLRSPTPRSYACQLSIAIKLCVEIDVCRHIMSYMCFSENSSSYCHHPNTSAQNQFVS